MKNIIILIVVAILTGTQCGYAQKKQYSDYNLRKAMELLDDNNPKEALRYVEKQLEKFPDDAGAYLIRAGVHRDEKHYSQALADLNKAIACWNKNCFAPRYSLFWWRGDIYFDLKEYDKAIADLEVAYKIATKENKSDSNEILMQQAHIYFIQKEYTKADKIYYRILKEQETELSPMIGLIRNMIAREEYDKAVDLADKCIALDASYDQTYRFRMQAYDKLGATDKAIDDALLYFENSNSPNQDEIAPIVKKHLSYAIAKASAKISNDNSHHWRMFRTTLYEWSHDYTKALAEYDKFEQEYGASPNIYFYRGECYCNLGDMASAIAEISKAIEMQDKDDYYLIVTRADYYRLAGRYKDAITDFTKAIEIDPSHVYGYYKRGWCYELMRDDDNTMKDYNAGIDIDKTYPYIYLMRGELRLKRGDKKGATLDFEEILRQDTTINGGSCRHYALHFLGRDTEAIEWMDKIIANDPEDNGNYYDQACLYSRMGRKHEAVLALRTAFEKGYRSFAHIEADDDLDAIRGLPEFTGLIEEYKGKLLYVKTDHKSTSDTIETVSEVQMKRLSSGIYEVPCAINNLPLRFVFDTGTSTVTISSVEAAFMLKNGYLKENDIKGKHYYSTASGDIHEGTIICLREIKIGDAILRNIEASVTHSQQAPLLLGQSVMERFGTITIDNNTSKLTIKQK